MALVPADSAGQPVRSDADSAAQPVGPKVPVIEVAFKDGMWWSMPQALSARPVSVEQLILARDMASTQLEEPGRACYRAAFAVHNIDTGVNSTGSA